MDSLFVFSLIFVVGTVFWQGSADPLEDKQALLDFLGNIPHSRALNWNQNSSVCSDWIGVTCDSNQTRVIALRLPGVGFLGPIPPNTLSRLSGVQVLSLRSNRLSGTFPSDFYKLRNLTALSLQSNSFSGPLPTNFSVWKNLAVVDLSNNAFNGSIPSSALNSIRLSVLDLASNSLSGEIPSANLHSLRHINLSHNNLSGTVPHSLQRFPISSFVGNVQLLYGSSIPPTPSTPPPDAQPAGKGKKLEEPVLLGLVIGGCCIGFVILAVAMIVCCSNKGGESQVPRQLEKGEPSSKKGAPEKQYKQNKLVFFDGCNLAFDLEDLLRASAEVLGKGTFGMTYRASLEDSSTVVVKRLKEVVVTKREFEQQMEVAGNIRHENLTPLRAYYHSKDEKLAMYEYYTSGSVFAMLHGKRGEGQIPLDWETRLKIAIGAARGIAYLHTQNDGKFVHGNIKASNIFLNSLQYGCVSDFGLVTLMGPVSPSVARVAGYRAPELADLRRASQASDVYSFGVLLLELLTGKSPIVGMASDGGRNEAIHLVRWVHSVVREEWTAEVFDVELLRYPNIEEEMVEMLQVGMACAVKLPEKRPKMAEVVKMVGYIRQAGTGNRASSEGSVSASPQQVIEMGFPSLAK